MERFQKQISVNNELRLFEFNRMKNMSGVKFFITQTRIFTLVIRYRVGIIGSDP
jgi:hypothetical protein